MINNLKSWEGGLLAIFLVTLVLNTSFAPEFLTVQNQINLFQLSIEKIIVALMMTLIIVNAEIDLSVASVMGLSAVVFAWLLNLGWGGGSAALVCLTVGWRAGIVKAALIAKGWIAALERSGVECPVDVCTYYSPKVRGLKGRVMTNAAKWAYYAPGMLGLEVAFGSLSECVESAIRGEVWRDPKLWVST